MYKGNTNEMPIPLMPLSFWKILIQSQSVSKNKFWDKYNHVVKTPILARSSLNTSFNGLSYTAVRIKFQNWILDLIGYYSY